jgi:hypothetical protein
MKRIISLSVLFLVPLIAFSQTFFGLQNSNYSGAHMIYTNPAALATMPFKRNVNFSSIGFNLNNNYFSLETPFTFWQLISNNVDPQYCNAKGNVDWQSEWLKENQGVNKIWANVDLEYRGPAYATRYGERLVWATAMRTRNSLNISNLSPQIVQWGKSLLDTNANLNLLDVVNQSFNVRANSYQEFSGSLSYLAINKKQFKLSIGATGKILLGLGSFNMSNNGSQFSAYGHDSIRVDYADIKVSYTDFDFLSQITKGVLLGSLPKLNNISGLGYGVDFGFSVESGNTGQSESMSKVVSNKNYKWKLSGAILDLGHINYASEATGYTIKTEKPVTMNLMTTEFIAAAANGSSGVFNYVTTFAKEKGIYQEIEEQTTIDLPTTIQLQFDYSVFQYFNVAMHWQQRLLAIQQNQFLGSSSLVVVPRFEHRWFELSTPLSFYDNYEQFGIGIFTRIGPIFIGSDNFLKSFTSNKYSGMNLYFGISSLLP